MTLQAYYPNDNSTDAQIGFWNGDGTPATGIEVIDLKVNPSNGTPAGQSSGGDGFYNFTMTLQISAGVSPGLKGVTVRNPNCDMPIPLPGVLYVKEID